MTAWYEVGNAAELPLGSMKGYEVGGSKAVLVHGASGVRAFEDRCGHMSTPLSIGTFKSGVLKCALHAAVFDAETGAVRGQPQMHMGGMLNLPPEVVEAMTQMGKIMAQIRCEPLRPFPVAIENGRVFVHL
jgi:nitrite reductase/ring-hydroxylating ferredoxin subunit